jgi:hypothetical protein
MPNGDHVRRFRSALYQEAHLVPERVLADRIVNLCPTAHLLTINRQETEAEKAKRKAAKA